MRGLEGGVFLAIAAGLHMGLWVVAPGSDGAPPSGDAGQSVMTLAPATSGIAELARQWQSSPEALTDLPPASTPAAIIPAALPAPAPASSTPAVVVPDRPSLPDTANPPAPEETPPAVLPAPSTSASLQPVAPKAVPRPNPQSVPQARPTPPTKPELLPPEAATLPKADTRPSKPQPKARAQGKPKNVPSSNGSEGAQSAAATQSAQSTALQAQWGAQIQRKVRRNVFYPRGAAGSGTARVALTVDQNGRLRSLQLIGSSGVTAFDEAAMRAVKRAGRFPRAPSGLDASSYRFTMGLNFQP